MTISDQKLRKILSIIEFSPEDLMLYRKSTIKSIVQELIESRSEISRMKGKCLCDCTACDSCLPGNGIDK
jgi:hypothetical protein